jgi:BMFP domain-containing protein YqiC
MSPAEQVRRLYEEAEARTATTMENLVGSEGFSDLLAMVTQNAMAITKVVNDSFDGVVSSLRLAGRGDIARLGKQLARTEDKLERLLQAVEGLEDLVAELGTGAAAGPAAAPPAPSAAAAPAAGSAAGPVADSTTPAKKAPAKKAPAKKAPARRTAAKKSAPARTAAARKGSGPRATAVARQPDGPAA